MNKKVKARNWHAVNAKFRKAGAMKNKKAYTRKPKHKGGSDGK